ncbi:MAG: hypothetical protein IJ109_03595 [Firmicutes bacterium]|nr:hypothetical protein [Bacillota bacterium]
MSRKKILIAVCIAACILGAAVFQSTGDRPYKFLKTDNVSEMKLTSPDGAARTLSEDETEKVIGVVRKTKTYSNVMIKDLEGDRYQIDIEYRDGHKRQICLLAEVTEDGVKENKGTPAITINKRWYRIKAEQAEAIIALFR